MIGGAALATVKFLKARPQLAEWEPLPAADCPVVSIIVPARNEERNIGRCVRSLLASRYPRFSVVVVNDRSTDRTRDVALEAAGGDPRLEVIDGAERPGDWAGKPWACWQGYQRATGPVLLFTDADTEHGPLLLPHAVSMLVKERADLASVMPLQEMKSFWERLVQPLFFLMLGLRYGSPAKLNRNTNPRDAIANGQFILVTRESYEAVGGHRRVQSSVIEDLEMAVAYTADRKKLMFALAEEDMKTRMYQSLPDLVEGWSKNVFIGMKHTMKSNTLAAVAMLGSMVTQAAIFLLPAAALTAGLITGRNDWLTFGAAAYLGASALIGAMLRAGHENPLWGLAHPAGALAQQWIFLRALLRGTRRIEWKGRVYSR